MKYPDSITVVRAPLVDTSRGQRRDWDSAARTSYSGLSVQASTTSEPDSDRGTRELVVSGWFVYTKPGTQIDILPTDRVEWSGVTGQLEVNGDIGTWPSPVTGAFHHQQFALKRVEG